MTADISRLQHIDALRAIAALLVVWLHGTELFVQVSPQIGSRWIADAAKSVDIGRIGVVIFFGISGFLIPSSLRGNGWASIQDFAIKRFFRLFPLFWLSIPLAVILMWIPFGREITASDFILNFTMIPEWLGAKPAIALYWTLQVELLFYVICALLHIAGILRHPATLAGATLICLCGAFGLNFVFRKVGLSPTDTTLWLNIAVMFIGSLWRAQSEKPLQFFPRFALYVSIAFVSIFLPIISLIMYASGRWPTPDAFLPYAIGLAVFLLLSRFQVIRSSFIGWLGEISYSIYLLHPLVLYPIIWAVSFKTGGYAPDLFISMLVVSAVTIGLSALTYRYVEFPAIMIGRRFTSGRKARRQYPA